MATGINRVTVKHQPLTYLLLSFSLGLLLFFTFCWNALSVQQQHTILEIRALTPGGSTPDGFFVSRKLNENAIEFKSISLKNNILLITFNTRAESEMAKNVLAYNLPEGFSLCQYEESDKQSGWLHDMLHQALSGTW